jgi:uncharacterized protein YktB (UPF0637 family)
MAGLGIGPDEFAIFRIVDPDERAAALEAALLPALSRVGDGLVGGLARVAGMPLAKENGKLQRRKDEAPEEVFVAFAPADRGHAKAPYLALAASRSHLHARVAARPAADRDGAIRRAIAREAANLARKGKPFRKLRSYLEWDHEDLPEIAPAQSTAFWDEVADGLAVERNGAGGMDLGIAWPAEEARSLALGDLLGAFRDLAPLYKLIANAR